MTHEQSKIEASNHREWFQSTFNADEIEQLHNIGVECNADKRFYKYEILDIFGHLKNRKLKKCEALHQKFIERYISLVPLFLRNQIDDELIRVDDYYAAWFFNRHCFFEEYRQAKSKSAWGGTRKLLWSPVIDNLTPDECMPYSNKIFNIDDEFLGQAILHWEKPRRGCRCALFVLSEHNARKQIESGQSTMWNI
ncbi:hypothetical protein [Acinetobacter sp. YH12021]|uniref:hypothetical protein n=1 Tax=Acinetobacter sp. YH12021 TaxID=2601040 RepID=UPI001C552F51|nr:hypothetical protein [Acinetobacter sp. YH12021]